MDYIGCIMLASGMGIGHDVVHNKPSRLLRLIRKGFRHKASGTEHVGY
jgi:hypothetical protein